MHKSFVIYKSLLFFFQTISIYFYFYNLLTNIKMSITRKEYEAFLTRFAKTEDNVVNLRREQQALREEMKVYNENVVKLNSILSKLSSCEGMMFQLW